MPCGEWREIEPAGKMKVYAEGDPSSPPILLLHELPGLLPETTCFADNLVKRGYRVYMPLFFGSVGRPVGTLRQLGVCAGPNFNCVSTSESAVVDKLRGLRDRIANAHKGRPLGIIGMCLTGAMPLALAEKNVAAVVVSQPAIPFGFTASERRSLGVSTRSVQMAAERGVHVLRIRFEKDCLVPEERFDTIAQLIPEKQLETEVVATNNAHQHSVLTVESKDPGAQHAISHAMQFLDRYVGNQK